MWFDIIRKKVVNMQVVRDIMIHINNIFYYSKNTPRHIRNSKFRHAFSTYVYIRDNMYAIEWDEVDEKKLPRVQESQAYVKPIEKILTELREWYNSIPKKTKTKNKNIFKSINKELNAANSLFLDSNFVFSDRSSWGTYYSDADTSTANLSSINNSFPDDEKKLIETITSVLSHEFGHQASESIDFPNKKDSFYEEMLAFLVQYPNDIEKAFRGWLGHPAVQKSIKGNWRRRQLYDDIHMATKTGIFGKKNSKLYKQIREQLFQVMDLQTNPTRSIRYN